VLRASNEPIGDLTGEWPVNWSLASYEDVSQFFQDKLFKEGASPGTTLGEVMSTKLTTTTPETKIDSISHLFDDISGLPVVKSKDEPTLVGVISKKDVQKGGTFVRDVYSHPPIAARTRDTVAHAACLMLKHKVHRIPVVDDKAKLCGIVTRTDIFTALALESGDSDVLTE
jgi:CBS domain-containing protein